MNQMLRVSLLGSAALFLLLGAASPAAGVWEGKVDGRKAVTLRLHETGGKLDGIAIFYIVRDNGDGGHDGEAVPAIRLLELKWDGGVLRFAVQNPAGQSVRFEMRFHGEKSGDLKRLETNGMPEEWIAIERRE
jgi:hypothetical protein